MKNTPVEAGRFAFFSPIPMLFATCLWSWVVVFGICFGLLRMNVPIPGWLICITVVPPFCCSPILGILGIIHGIIKRNEKRAWLGILLSALNLVENALLFYAIGYLSRFQQYLLGLCHPERSEGSPSYLPYFHIVFQNIVCYDTINSQTNLNLSN